MAPLIRLDLLAASSLICWVVLAAVSRSGTVSVALLLTILALTWVALIAAWRTAGSLPHGRLLPRLWVWAVLFRLAGFAGQPILEDDYFRYLWDGFRFAVSGNPYVSPPAAFFGDPAIPDRFQAILDGINHPHLTTIYGPLCQWAFRLAYWIAPGELGPWKALVIAADLATVALLLRMTDPAKVLLYAWCPLLIQETAFTAHPESLGALALVAAIFCRRRGWFAATAAALVAAAAVKMIGALIAPFLLWRAGWRAWLTGAATAAALWGPFWLYGGATEWTALRQMSEEWEFNSSVFAIARAAGGQRAGAILCGAAMVAGYAWIWRRRNSFEAPRGDWIYGGFFLLAPVVNAWYLLWMLPFAALRPAVWALAALALVSSSYLCGPQTGDPALTAYEHPVWVRLVEYGGILAAGAWSWREAAG